MHSSDKTNLTVDAIKIPKNLILICILVGVLIPYVARLPSIPTRGLEWLTDYLPSIGVGFLFLTGLNLIPSGFLYVLGKSSEKKPLAFWVSIVFTAAYLIWAHGSVNLKSSSTASIALFFIPIYGVGAAFLGWVTGLLLNSILNTDRVRLWVVGVGSLVLLSCVLIVTIQKSVSVVTREEKFPIILIDDLQLSKKNIIFKGGALERVEALAFDEFDSHDGRELAVLGNSSLSLLDVPSYVIKSQKVIANECDHTCISMYPRLVASGHGKTLIASSAGVADSEGNQQWRLNSEGFTRLIPIKLHDKEPTYVSYQNMERITRHDVNGKMVWNANIPAYDVGVYKTKDGEQLPFAIVGKRNSSELNIFDIEGQFKTKFLMPFTAGNVESINWPSPGHLLAGSGAMISVFSVDGTEVFKHVIQNTSFRPYHGPYGVSVRFDNNKEPYLAVISHGSSGYSRSILLVFDQVGKLVWQEELNKLRALTVVPKDNTNAEVLLVGGMDGVIEYRIKPSTPNN